MKTITDREADDWIATMTPEGIRKIVQEHHALRQGLCYQILLVATGADDWVDRSIAAARRAKTSESALRRLVCDVENAASKARDDVRDTTCTNCMGCGRVGDGSCCVCRGTGLRTMG